jgi:hypothetical protein
MVVFRVTGGKQGKPCFEALDVQRMPADACPRRGGRSWMRRKPFMKHAPELEANAVNLPILPFMYGTNAPTDDLVAQLADRVVWPDWLKAMAERHELVADLLSYQDRYGGISFPGDWVVTGHLLQGRFERGKAREETGEGADFVWAEFGIGDNMAIEEAVTVRLSSPVPGFSQLRRLTRDRQEIAATLMIRLIYSAYGALDNEFGRMILNGEMIYAPSIIDRHGGGAI